MSSFTEPLSSTQLPGLPRRWRLDREFRYYVGKEDSDRWIDALPGFEFAGSIPRICWFVDAPNGDGAAGYCIHDLLYSGELVPRQEADAILYESLGVLGLNAVRRYVIWSSVRAGGWAAYRDHTPKTIAAARAYARTSFAVPPVWNGNARNGGLGDIY